MRFLRFLIPFILLPVIAAADVSKIGRKTVQDVHPEQEVIFDHFEATTGWTALGNDTTGLATDLDHTDGTKSLEFDKVNGAANTAVAGIQKTLSSVDLTGYHNQSIIHWSLNVSTVADIDYAFIRLGTSASHYNEWRVDDTAIAVGWNLMAVTLGIPSTTGNTGNGANFADIDYVVVGVVFDAETSTLADIRVDHVAIHSSIHSTASLSTFTETSVSSPNVIINQCKDGVNNICQNEDTAFVPNESLTKLGARRIDTLATTAASSGDWAAINQNATGALYAECSVQAASATGLLKLEDVAHASGNAGVLAIAVRNDALAALADTDGDNAPLQVDANGALFTNSSISAVVPGVGATNLGKAEDAAHADGDVGVLRFDQLCHVAVALAKRGAHGPACFVRQE